MLISTKIYFITYNTGIEILYNFADIDIDLSADNCHRSDRVDHTRLLRCDYYKHAITLLYIYNLKTKLDDRNLPMQSGIETQSSRAGTQFPLLQYNVATVEPSGKVKSLKQLIRHFLKGKFEKLWS